MNNIFDLLKVNIDEIKKLRDDDFRELIGLLCMCSLREYKFDTSSVHFGGHQNEKDGGIDVLVDAGSVVFENHQYIKSAYTGIQVKVTNMTPSHIQKEMLTEKGVIKDCINDIAKHHGYYIIISAKADLAYEKRSERFNCMNKIIDDHGLKDLVNVDFYGTKEIATWVNCYPSMILWVKEKVGSQKSGWKPYQNWSYNTNIKEFYYDEDVKIMQGNNILNVLEGINEIRSKLHCHRNIVRLLGFSGVGKTRLAQALFEIDIGENYLDPNLVVYGDLESDLYPAPIKLLEYLLDNNLSAILVVDNCDAKTHENLARMLMNHRNAMISLLTIECDVKDDEQEDTDYYLLQHTSSDVLRQVLYQYYPNVNGANIETIIEVSDCNFRLALYLVKTISKDHIGILNNEELFKRMFHQKNNESLLDQSLLLTAKSCSLVYSFSFDDDLQNEENEINRLASIVNMDPYQFYRNVVDLTDRQIIQKRQNWRAVLPQALANKLCKDFFKKTPWNMIYLHLNENKRLFLSMFRRLQYFEQEEFAVKIANEWMSNITNEQFLHLHVPSYNSEIIACITVIDPIMILDRLENVDYQELLNLSNRVKEYWVSILIYCAYDEAYFERSLKLMIVMIISNYKGQASFDIGRLFQPRISATQASLELRLKVIQNLIQSSNMNKKELGKLFLTNTLNHHCSYPLYNLPVNKRDYGLEVPIDQWFSAVFGQIVELYDHDYINIKELLIRQFYGLISTGLKEELLELIKNVNKKEKWIKLWKELLIYKRREDDEMMIDFYNQCLNLVRPTTTIEKIKVFGNDRVIHIECDEHYPNISYQEQLFELGKEISSSFELYLKYIKNDYSLECITDGIISSTDHLSALCNKLIPLIDHEDNAFKMIGIILNRCNEKQRLVVLNDLYALKIEPSKTMNIMSRLKLNNSEIDYLLKVLSEESNIVFDDITFYFQENTSISKITQLLDQVSQFDGGIKVFCNSIEIFGDNNSDINKYVRNWMVHHLEYLNSDTGSYIIETCFKDIKDSIEVMELFSVVKENMIMNAIDSKLILLLNTIGSQYPFEFLNCLIKDKSTLTQFMFRVIGQFNPVFANVDIDQLFQWIKENDRIIEVCKIIDPIIWVKDHLEWSEIALRFMQLNDDRVMEILLWDYFYNHTNGLESTYLKQNKHLLDELCSYVELEKSKAIQTYYNKQLKSIESSENQYQVQFESFEDLVTE